MAGRFNIVARQQYKLCTAAESNAAYLMITPAVWHVLVGAVETVPTAPTPVTVTPTPQCLFELTIPVDFPLKAPQIRPLSADFGPICTDGVTSVLGAVEVAAAEIPPGATVDKVKFAAELAAFAELAPATPAVVAPVTAGPQIY